MLIIAKLVIIRITLGMVAIIIFNIMGQIFTANSEISDVMVSTI